MEDKDLREKIAEKLYFMTYPNGYGGVWKGVPGDVKEHWRLKADQILALLQPLREESEARHEIIRRLTTRCEELIQKMEEAKREERERILNLLPNVLTKLPQNRNCFDCTRRIKRQALKGGE